MTVAGLAAMMAMTVGCAVIGQTEKAGDDTRNVSQANERRPPPRTIPLEVWFIRHDLTDPMMVEDLWAEADEQRIPPEIRQRLAANGLRAGILNWPPPFALAARFTVTQGDGDRSAESGQLPADSLLPEVSRRTLRLLPEQPSQVVASPAESEIVVLHRDEDRVLGATFREAAAVFEVRARADSDGKTAIDVLPVIEHGPRNRDWIGEDGVFRLEAGKDREAFASLHIAVTVATDAALVIAAQGAPNSTVGDAFLRGRQAAAKPQQTLVFRPLQRTSDPAFSTPADGR